MVRNTYWEKALQFRRKNKATGLGVTFPWHFSPEARSWQEGQAVLPTRAPCAREHKVLMATWAQRAARQRASVPRGSAHCYLNLEKLVQKRARLQSCISAVRSLRSGEGCWAAGTRGHGLSSACRAGGCHGFDQVRATHACNQFYNFEYFTAIWEYNEAIM